MLIYEELSNELINSFFEVYNRLGYGFLEKVYENALKIELESRGLKVVQQPRIKVYFKSFVVGDYVGDLLLEDKIMLELKCAVLMSKENELQLYNYLRATHCKVGYLLNFGKTPQFKRIVNGAGSIPDKNILCKD